MPKQVNENLQIVDGKDEVYTNAEINNLIIQNLESEKIVRNFPLKDIQNLRSKIRVDYQNKGLYFLAKNFTWVGGPHSTDKKRIQVSLSEEEKESFYNKQLFIIGIYHYGKIGTCGLYEASQKTKERK